MRSLRWLYVAFCGFLLNGQVGAQQWAPSNAAELKESLKRNERQVKAMPAMKLILTMAAYNHAGDATPQDQGSSVVWHRGNLYKAEHFGMTTYQNNDIRVVVDPKSNTIILSDPQDLYTSLSGALQDSLLASARSIGCAVEGGGARYRLKMAPWSAYDVLEVAFDAKGWLRKIEMYWAQPVPLDPGDPLSATVLPKVVISLDVPELLPQGIAVPDPGSVVSWTAAKPEGKGPWKDYSIYASRPR